MISLVDIGAGLWPYAHNSKDATYGGWWNDLDMIEIGNGGPNPSPPTPPPAPSPSSSMWPWAVDPAQAGAGWTLDSDGTIKNSAASGLCLTADHIVDFTPCSASQASKQQFTLDKANGNVYLTAKKGTCLALNQGYGPGIVMAMCKQGGAGMNEEFTLTGGKLCSTTLAHPTGKAVCLKPEATCPNPQTESSGFNCVADTAALERCRVHFTMWTIMKAPLLLG
jgi:hypothetical protein